MKPKRPYNDSGNFAADTFTSARAQFLQTLSGQMSMALGNAKLYSNLDATIKALEVESQARKRAMEVLAESAKKYRSLVER